MTQKINSSAAPKQNPKTETIATTIHFYAKDAGWNVSIKDLVALTNFSTAQIRRVCEIKGWSGRLRASKGPALAHNAKIGLSVDPEDISPLQFD